MGLRLTMSWSTGNGKQLCPTPPPNPLPFEGRGSNGEAGGTPPTPPARGAEPLWTPRARSSPSSHSISRRDGVAVGEGVPSPQPSPRGRGGDSLTLASWLLTPAPTPSP